MPRRSRVSLEDVAHLDTLATAFWQAARRKQKRPEVARFAAHLDAELARLRDDILTGRAPEAQWTTFRIFDPKPRRILAPSLRDRVLHHALMLHMAPVLERSLVDDTFACRPLRGTLAAVARAEQHLRRFPVFVKADVRAYFASIDHAILSRVLERRFKNAGLLRLCRRILERTPDPPGRGLPIGALTSQHFANVYLDALDRFLLAMPSVRGLVRYMDDIVWFCDTPADARATLCAARRFAAEERGLELKPDACIGPSTSGLPFLGFRILRGTRRLSLRRRRRYAAARRRAERAFAAGEVDARGLQAAYDAALAITAHADGAAWRRAELRRRPPIDA